MEYLFVVAPDLLTEFLGILLLPAPYDIGKWWKVFPKYSGYRIYDDGLNKIVMTSTKQTSETDYALSVQFEPQIMQFSGIALSNVTDKTQRSMLIELLQLYGFQVDSSFLAKIDSAEKNKKVIELKVSGKTLVIDPLVASPAGHIHIYYKWWDDRGRRLGKTIFAFNVKWP